MAARAKEASDAARAAYREKRAAEREASARALAAERRTPAVAALPTADRVEGTYLWVDGNPKAGGKAYVVYNVASGPLKVGDRSGLGGLRAAGRPPCCWL